MMLQIRGKSHIVGALGKYKQLLNSLMCQSKTYILTFDCMQVSLSIEITNLGIDDQGPNLALEEVKISC